VEAELIRKSLRIGEIGIDDNIISIIGSRINEKIKVQVEVGSMHKLKCHNYRITTEPSEYRPF